MAEGTIGEWERTQEIVRANNAGAQHVLHYIHTEVWPEVKNTSIWQEYDMDNYDD